MAVLALSKELLSNIPWGEEKKIKSLWGRILQCLPK
jgi:hypothetical protein